MAHLLIFNKRGRHVVSFTLYDMPIRQFGYFFKFLILLQSAYPFPEYSGFRNCRFRHYI